MGFRNNGKRLRGSQWTKSAKYQSCTYFGKEQDHYGDISLATQDPHAPNVDFERHWQEHGLHLNSNDEGHIGSRDLDISHHEAPNDNKQWAPKIDHSMFNPKDGHVIRHSRRKSRGHDT